MYHKKSAFWITILKDIQIKERAKKWKMNNGLQKIGKVDYDRRFLQKIEGYDCNFKRYSKEKAQKKVKI